MSETKDGGPAFPQRAFEHHGEWTDTWSWGIGGMSLRDYFAAKAMAAIVGQAMRQLTTADKISLVAEDAYLMADAMLRAREAK